MALIYISTAEGDPLKYKLPDTPGMEVLIGRNDECQISLPQVNGISGVHCSLYFDGAQYYIIDRQSTNGVFCNGERIENAIMGLGNVYTIGEATIVFDPETPVTAPSVQAPSQQQAAQTAAPGPRRRRAARPAVSANRLGSAVPKYQAKKTSAAAQVFTFLYVVVMLSLAFYAGMVLRHWNETGEVYLPWIDPDPQAAAPAEAPKA